MNRSKLRAKKDRSFPPNPELIEKKTKDSLDYVKGFAGLCNENRVIFIFMVMTRLKLEGLRSWAHRLGGRRRPHSSRNLSPGCPPWRRKA